MQNYLKFKIRLDSKKIKKRVRQFGGLGLSKYFLIEMNITTSLIYYFESYEHKKSKINILKTGEFATKTSAYSSK